MIRVEYIPSDSGDIGDGDRIKTFETHADFRDWVKRYVCDSCLKDFKGCHDRAPITVRDYLNMGCGCEVDIDDPEKMIDWDDKILS